MRFNLVGESFMKTYRIRKNSSLFVTYDMKLVNCNADFFREIKPNANGLVTFPCVIVRSNIRLFIGLGSGRCGRS